MSAIGTVQFHYAEGCQFKLSAVRAHKAWLQEICKTENKTLHSITIVFCTDDYLLEINRQYLEHDYYTDIITFDLGTKRDSIEGELYLSIDRIKENAKENSVPLKTETQRVMAHGLLHLCGYGDKSEEEIQIMRKKEDLCIALLEEMFHVEQANKKGL